MKEILEGLLMCRGGLFGGSEINACLALATWMQNLDFLNARGLGTDDKVDWVKELGVREIVIVFGLQETKLKEVDEKFVRRLRNGDDLGFARVNANGSSGSLITIWNASVFTGTHTYTRNSDDGMKFSKLERFLVSKGFCDLWPELSVVALDRKLSDHCLIMLRDTVVNFDPKPFRVFDIWFKERVTLENRAKRTLGNLIGRKNKNNMGGLMVGGRWSENPKEIKRGGFDYYKTRFTKSINVRLKLVTNGFKRITEAEACRLEEKFTEGEVWMAVKNCGFHLKEYPRVSFLHKK
nr:reverse transcriptase domain, reverse transcriptase zinc-binding domain protein [Tanacetum cinerariifolium]